MSYRKKLGMEYGQIDPVTTQGERINYINIKLAALGLPVFRPTPQGSALMTAAEKETHFLDLFDDFLQDYQEKKRMVNVDEIGIHKRINDFFARYFEGDAPKAAAEYFVLDHYGLARELSLPPDRDTFANEHIQSHRIKQGVLHNPKNDRRTTKGSFHITEGGLAIPLDKKAVPKETFSKLYAAAVTPPDDLLALPFTSSQKDQAKTFVALLIKPIVSPAVPGVTEEKTMENLFLVPGSFVSSADFLESVYGNAGDPGYHANDSGLDVHGWSGHTGYIILAPHLTQLRKIDIGLPHSDRATERQKRDGMCYTDPEELYNDGQPFKLTCRDHSGVTVTLIADNYFGYSKKEVKTQLSFAANLYGGIEEEHAGGTIAHPRQNLGESFHAQDYLENTDYSFDEVVARYGSLMHVSGDHYGIDKRYPTIYYLPENVEIDLNRTEIQWTYKGETKMLRLKPDFHYVLPNGDRLHMEKHPAAPAWKLILTEAEGLFCHKPCTVSGGGKSEISKSIDNAIIYGTYFVNDLDQDLDRVSEILSYDYKHRWKVDPHRQRASRSILSPERTLGSVIKLLSPSPDYTDAFNAYIASIPNHVKALVFLVKRFYKPSWGDDWRSHFSVDYINGKPGHEIKFDHRTVRPSHLRVGFEGDDAWRVFKLRMDFMASEKIQMEDDVSASVVVPARQLKYLNPEYHKEAYKFVSNCEYRFFQRPDDAIHKGYDKKAEKDLSSSNLFATNFAPLTKTQVQEIKDDVVTFTNYTEPVKTHINNFLAGQDTYCVVSSEPRLVDGKPSKNPRYLEHRADFIMPIRNYLSDLSMRLTRRVPLEYPVLKPVNAILPGRRNNPPGMENGQKIPPLSVYNPIHYQELPELFMDYISSLTGKSPSTTGAGSEGALTKGPFNMLLPVYDLNSALLFHILGDYHAFSTPAGHVGPTYAVDHDISYLVPELWARLSEEERDPKKLIAEGSFEKLSDFEYEGRLVPASRLGYRMTNIFSYKYLGKIFDEPQTVFTEEILKPEQQDLQAFVDGIRNIERGQKKAALQYLEDGTADQAIPPLKALIRMMADGEYEGMTVEDPSFRELFTRDSVLHSNWYHERLKAKQQVDLQLIERKIEALDAFVANPVNRTLIDQFGYGQRLADARELRDEISSEVYLSGLFGTLGVTPGIYD